ncbi:MAG TPA: molybdopterin-dependent oxidoreductase, partial [Limnochordia bacterium]|nr:molybdopterin-dependent oxidoreductase [Limnochordia bacterium]
RALEADQLARYHLARAIQRRRLLVGGLQAAAGLVALGYGWRWLIRASGSDQTPSAPAWPDGTPKPQPLPASAPPQGGGAAGRFRIYNVAPKLPVWDPAGWRLAVDGLVDKPLRLTWTELLKIPRTVLVRDFHCVTGWSVYHVTWEGVLLDDLLDYVGVQAGATHVKFHAYDNEYTDALSLGQARLPDVMVALLKDGQPLTQEEGQPLRLLVPQMFGYKSVKWLTRIELIDSAHIGFWERLGYSNDAWLRRDHPRV